MADNVTADAGAGGAVFATDDIGGVHYPYTKIVWGPDNTTNLVDDASGKRLPMYLAETINVPVTDAGGSLTVDGTVAISAVVAGTGATNLGKAEDAAHSSGDVGVMALTVRSDTAAATAGTDGDYQPLVSDSTGRLHVNVGNTVTVASHAVTNAGTFATQAAQSGTWTVQPGNTANTTPWLASIHDGTNKASVADLVNSNPLHVSVVDANGDQITSFGGGTQYTEDAAAAANPAGNALILVREDARGGSLTSADGDNVAARGTNAGELYVKHVDSIPVTDNGGSLTVDGTVAVSGTVTVGSHAVTNAGTFAVQVDGSALTALQLIDDVVFTDDTAFAPATSKVAMIGAQLDDTSPDPVDEGDAGALRMSANRNLYVRIRDNAGNERGLNIDANGEFQISGTRNAIAVTDNSGSLTTDTAGDIAHDAADSGNPLKLGAKATTAITGITLVADADRTNLFAGVDGVLITRDNANLESLTKGTASITDGSSTSVIAAAGANVKTYITDVIISNSSSTYVTVDIRDGTAGSVLATFPAPATSGCVHRLGSPIGGTANTAVAADPSASASTITVTLCGFKSKV